MIFLLVIIGLFIVYSALVLYYAFEWNSIPEFKAGTISSPVKFSVIVPARNEESTISILLQALEVQTYPRELFEVIVVDDDSTDGTGKVVSAFPNVKLIRAGKEFNEAHKKRALETGIASAVNDWIITTDADCRPGPEWLQLLASCIGKEKPVFIVAPVVFEFNASVLQLFQGMDFMVLQAITGAAAAGNRLSMCNGANLCYSKEVFEEVKGFESIDHIASGDDMLLMYKIWQRYPEGIRYLKSQYAIVATRPMNSWKAFINQRIRWASKAKHYQDKRLLPVLLLVYIFNLSFPVLLVAGILYPYYWLVAGVFWAGKTVVELPLFWAAAKFFDKKWTLKYFFFFQPLHILYTVVSGFLGQAGSYEWKGRRVR